jgi:hypothetical protein
MLDLTTKHHLDRLRLATTSKYDHTQLSRWVSENTTINSKPYSFIGHEFQAKFMDDPAPIKVARKCSQVGLSETSMRIAAAYMGVMQNFCLIYVLPTASFAATYGKTRFTPNVEGSPTLKAMVSPASLDNQDVKQFGSNYLWMRGASSDNAPISVAADAIIFDEYSFCDITIASQFQSRLSHSKYRWKVLLSTPTFDNDPIDEAFQQSRRHWNTVRCLHCAHRFVPNYYENVVIPGWDKHLDEINKDNLHKTRFREAYVACPHCGKHADLSHENRDWVVENNEETWIASGYQIQPFDAPSIISVPYLVEASTAYSSKSQFRNYNLGIPSQDAESGLTDADMENAAVETAANPFHYTVLGIDLGNMCHFTVGGVGPDGKFGVIHMEKVPLARFRERYWALKGEYRVMCTVSDSQPMVDLVMSMCSEDNNFYGAIYVTRQSLDFFEVRMRDADADRAMGDLRQVLVNRNQAFDKLLSEVRLGNIWFRRTEQWQTYKEHAMDMKRARAALRNGEMTSSWVKSSKGNDHFWHATAYCFIAAQMRGLVTQDLPYMPGVSTFKLKAPV